ncbi:hypothetical protein NQ318_015950 [Aromia moschata]|uniref:CHHC U11-48K-type domain-containing protein n=1 Tax=Aromia moschata TaxID=1265417 RepID=A0AAV8XSZ4_9CUCU|nr:hypothetical protein NQ318_015950 [Aromia moschata]
MWQVSDDTLVVVYVSNVCSHISRYFVSFSGSLSDLPDIPNPPSFRTSFQSSSSEAPSVVEAFNDFVFLIELPVYVQVSDGQVSAVFRRSSKVVKCPFNSQHIMPESSLQRHIIRCMVNYPDYVTCPYNALHRFRNKDLLHEHMMELK